MKRLKWLALAGTMLLAGCDLAPPYQRPVTEIPVAFKSDGKWQPAHLDGVLPEAGWWRQYGDAELDALERQVVASNPDLVAATADYDAARAYAAEAESGFFPTLAIGGFATANRQSDKRPLRSANQPSQYGANTLQGELNYEVDLWDRVHNEVAAGRRAAQASAADLADVQLSLEAQLADDYVRLRGLDARLVLLRETVRGYRDANGIVQSRYKGKIASGIEVARAQLQLHNAQALVDETKAQRALLEHAIASLVGMPASDFAIAPGTLRFALPKVPVALPSVLLERRPDIAAAERRAAAANKLIGVARAAFYPQINLNAIGGFQNTGGADLLTLPYTFWSVGPAALLPVFEGGLRRAEESAAYAQYRTAVGDYRSTVLGAFQQVEDELSLLNNLGQEQVSVNAAVKDAGQEASLANTMYLSGAASELEVVIAQTADLQAQIDALNLRTRRLQASVALFRALGGGWTAHDLPALGKTDRLAADTPG